MAEAYTRIGDCWVKLGDTEQAIGFFKKSLFEHRDANVLIKLREAEKSLAAQKPAEMQDQALTENVFWNLFEAFH